MGNSKITCISLCSGYEGLGLGLRRVIQNLRVILYSEIEIYACEVLAQRMEEGKIDVAPIWSDLKTLSCKRFFGKVDILTAGYPCPPFSVAGKRKGAEDPRHLWPHIKRIISECRPEYCFFENVEGHISLGLETVLSDLGELGYRVETGIFSAAEVGAPHQRKRIFILGHSDEPGLERWNGGGLQKHADQQTFGTGSARQWPARPGQKQFEWEEPRTI